MDIDGWLRSLSLEDPLRRLGGSTTVSLSPTLASSLPVMRNVTIVLLSWRAFHLLQQQRKTFYRLFTRKAPHEMRSRWRLARQPLRRGGLPSATAKGSKPAAM
jgi:hypothetical protein